MASKKAQEQEYAKYLFTEKGLSQKEIAQKVGVTEKTVGNWVKANDEEWKKIRKSLLNTKKTQISRLYDQLEKLNEEIASRPIVTKSMTTPIKIDKEGNPLTKAPEYDPIVLSNVPTSKEADIISKITKAIQQLEGETSVGAIIETAMGFCDFLRGIDLEFAQEVTRYFDLFISDKLK
jgi:transcriptional regulator with XRE-family HTH domain